MKNVTSEEIEQWLKAKLAARELRDPDTIDANHSLDAFGLDSVEAVALTGELETFLKRRVEPTALWDHRSIRSLALALAGEQAPPRPQSTTDGMSDSEVDALLRKMMGTK